MVLCRYLSVAVNGRARWGYYFEVEEIEVPTPLAGCAVSGQTEIRPTAQAAAQADQASLYVYGAGEWPGGGSPLKKRAMKPSLSDIPSAGLRNQPVFRNLIPVSTLKEEASAR